MKLELHESGSRDSPEFDEEKGGLTAAFVPYCVHQCFEEEELACDADMCGADICGLLMCGAVPRMGAAEPDRLTPDP